VDLVVEGLGGRVVGFEVKLTATPSPKDGSNLSWLRDKLGQRMVDMVILTTGGVAHRRVYAIAVVPLAPPGP
jgi:hypothetical protein